MRHAEFRILARHTAGVVAVVFGLAVSPAHAELIPMNAWVHDPAISSVGVSPDGSKLAALTISDLSQPPDITVWDTNNLGAPPKRFRPEDSKVFNVGWLSNDRLAVIGRQAFDYRLGGRTTRWFRDKLYIVDSQGKSFRDVFKAKDVGALRILNRLPLVPDKILIEATNFEFATDIYEVNLENLLAVRVFRGASGENFLTDYKGEVRGKTETLGRGGEARIEFSYRDPVTGSSAVHHSLYAAEREGMSPAGFDPDGRTVYMEDNTGRDKYVIVKYDLIERKTGEVVFGDGSFEATGILQSEQPEDFGEVVGFTGQSEKSFRVYRDDEWATIQERIDAALPPGRTNLITSISTDFSVAVISSSGPTEPAAYYLMIGGQQLAPLGRSYPLLDPDKLSQTEYVTYKARDGLEIPAYLTLPTGGSVAPYPAIVMPHGGPWARDSLTFDMWAQFLANRGYAVLQPQYRGSMGWGQQLWRAGDREWGRKMQDDKDDGARWLVDQGLADPDRLAMFGYSYGGYAAMASIVRADTPYQCAIAGAGLSELRTFDKITFEGEFGRAFQNPTIAGLSPLDHAKEAKIPIFIFHGDRDQRVPIEQSKKYVSALKSANKDVEYLEVVDLWHSYPWFPQHHLAVLSSMEDYLANRCGPGGL